MQVSPEDVARCYGNLSKAIWNSITATFERNNDELVSNMKTGKTKYASEVCALVEKLPSWPRAYASYEQSAMEALPPTVHTAYICE